MKDFERTIRAGSTLPASMKSESTCPPSPIATQDSSDDSVLPPLEIEGNGCTDEGQFLFSFRKKIKARGRPKRSSKQLTFNKTSADRGMKCKGACDEEPVNKRRRESSATAQSDDDDKSTCLICHLGITNARKRTLTLTKCCSAEVHKTCLKKDGCPRCNDFDEDFDDA